MSILLTPVEVFYSFAEVDAPLLEQLEHHLNVLRHEGVIATWHKRQIVAGSDWQVELDRHLNTASLILLLISPDYLASDYQYGVELQQALQRHKDKEARVIPIVLRPCDWEGAPFAKLEVVPRNRKAITLWRNRDHAFTEIVKEIRIALETIQHLTLSTPPTTLPKIWQVPYQRNPLFTGREKQLQTLTKVLHMNESAFLSRPRTHAISGLGGVGKTQLAVEYAYRAAQHYKAVFWVGAETQETLVSGYAALAVALNLQEKDKRDQDLIIQAVRYWLQIHTTWLLILDNVEELSLVERLLPPVFGGHVLITTRSQITGRFVQRLEIDSLHNEEGALLLLRRAGMLSAQGMLEETATQDVALAEQISEELGGLPLALDQAGAYIDETACGLRDYQQRYQKRRTFLLQRRGKLASDHPQPVATTWSLSFEKVEQTNSTAAQLLRFCAFLAPNAIPEELLAQALLMYSHVSDTSEKSKQGPGGWPFPLTSGDKIELETLSLEEQSWEIDEAVAVLRAYSLIIRNLHFQTLSIHPLIQVILRDSMTAETRKQWAAWVVQIVQTAHPNERDLEQWDACERWLPHMLMCVDWIEQEQMTTPEAAHLLNEAGYYLDARARYRQAEPLFKRALGICEQQLKVDLLDTITSLDNLGILYHNQGRYIEAEPMLKRAFETCERQWGTEHLETARRLNNLALLYREQGKYEQAEPLLKRALTIREDQLGTDHPETSGSLGNLGAFYRLQGKYEQAEPLLKRTFEIFERQLGADHPETATSLNNLANVYFNQQKYAEAEPLFKRALSIRKQQLGSHHTETASSLNNLACLYSEQKKYREAELLYQQALQIYEEQLGIEHSHTVMSLNSLARLYKVQKKYAEAEPLYRRVLAARERQLGAKHPDILDSLNNLVDIYFQQGKNAEVEPLLQQILTIVEEYLGVEHPSMALSLNNLAALYQMQHRYEEAESLYQYGLQLLRQQSRAEHPNAAIILYNLALLYEALGKYAEAESWLKRALAMFESVLGPNDAKTQTVRKHYAILRRSVDRGAEERPLEDGS